MRILAKTTILGLFLLASTGCIVVGGYSSDRGLWIWPGSIILVLLGLLLFGFMIFRRRR